ncbi:MAG: late competence development ComFB family protein [Spirulina sp.]
MKIFWFHTLPFYVYNWIRLARFAVGLLEAFLGSICWRMYMAKNLVNLTLLLVKEDLDQILAEQPDSIQRDFIKRDLFTDLMAYVLSRIPNNYIVLEEGQIPPVHSHLQTESAERQLARERMIRQGIYFVLEKSFHNALPTMGLKKSKTPQLSV